MRTTACLSLLLGSAYGHGQMTIPASRNGATATTAGGCPNLGSSNGHDICAWMTNGINIQGAATLPPAFITTGPDHQFCTTNPWNKPGSIPLEKPCGHVGGQDGRDLPRAAVTTVQAGSDLEVAWAINANHGGGYSYRICPSSPNATEACFQRTVLAASASNRDCAWIQQGADKSTRTRIPMLRTTTGTFPAGSEWTRNPIPDRSNYFPPPNNDPSLVGHGPFPWSIVESYAIPANTTAGPYMLSWRWDCEGSPQIWVNCADLHVEAAGAPTPTPPTPPPTPPAPTPKPVPTPAPTKPAACPAQTASARDCGWVGIDQGGCENQGCCWKPVSPNPSNLPWCYFHN